MSQLTAGGFPCASEQCRSFHHDGTACGRSREPGLLCSDPGIFLGLFLQRISEVVPAPQEGSRCKVFAAVSPQHPDNSPGLQLAMFNLKGMVLIRLFVSRGNKTAFSSYLSLCFLHLSTDNGLGYLLFSVIFFYFIFIMCIA